jgi:SOS-response transcriptional repressor LexA
LHYGNAIISIILDDVADNTRKDLREWRRKHFENQDDIAKRLGISRGYYATLENGHQATPEHIEDKLKALGYGKTETDGRRVSLVFGPMAEVPVVGTVSAGPGVTNVDSESGSVYVPMSLQQIGGIGFVIDGDSMMPALQPGDVALFREMHQPRNGFTFLLKSDGEFRCKNVVWRSGEWVMESLNQNKEKYPDQALGDWQILGVLVGWYRSVGSYEKLEADPHGLRLDGPV